MNIKTQRLILQSCSLAMMDSLLAGNPGAGPFAGYTLPQGWPEPDLIEAMPVFRELMLGNGPDGFNLWLIARKDGNRLVGSAGYTGRADLYGGIEVGFGIIAAERKHGYCREAVSALLDWGVRQPGVKFIKAVCEPANLASRRTLAKLGFKITKDGPALIEWNYR